MHHNRAVDLRQKAFGHGIVGRHDHIGMRRGVAIDMGKRILEPIKGRLTDTLREMHEDLQSSISYAGGRVLTDLKKVNYVILGGENAGEHLFM